MSPEGSPGCRIPRGHCSRTESVLGARLIRLGYCFTPGERGVPTHRRVRSHGHDRRSPAPRKRRGDRNRARRRHRPVRLVLILGTIIGATPGATQQMQHESLRPGVDCIRCPAGRTASTRAPASGRGERPACGVAPGGSMPELAYMGATDDSCTRESSSAYSAIRAIGKDGGDNTARPGIEASEARPQHGRVAGELVAFRRSPRSPSDGRRPRRARPGRAR
jgi:hypothetical protein